MKGYGSGIIRCGCSTAMARGKNVKINARSPRRQVCPNCQRMLRVKLITKAVNRTPGTTATQKQKRRDKVSGHVAVLEAENRELRAKVKKLEQEIALAATCVKEMQEERTHRPRKKKKKEPQDA